MTASNVSDPAVGPFACAPLAERSRERAGEPSQVLGAMAAVARAVLQRVRQRRHVASGRCSQARRRQHVRLQRVRRR